MGNSLGAGKIIFIVMAAILAISLVAYGVMRITVFADQAESKMTLSSGEFNQQWKAYGNSSNGADLTTLIEAIVKNNKNNKSEASMLVDVAYQVAETDDFTIIKSTVKSPNYEKLEKIKNDFKPQHGYFLEYITSKSTGNISGIIIKYGRNQKADFTPDET